eukprot:TRINITY_DN6202_c0_g1_i1.p2 TRINITY_DN6202_c0_g1~~TRINITY_DN6202_c0_g1_i1.p2  ORF type:complete len:183 (-),score=66.24 TRINITY_DN6202_c0_g1_i1:46-594(-)
MIGRSGSKTSSAGLGRKTIVHEQHIPTFLKKVLDKEAKKQELQEKLLAERGEKPETEEEAPVIVAEEDLKREFEEAEKQRKVLAEQELIKQKELRREAEDERMKKKLMETSKFGTTESTTHVFRAKRRHEDTAPAPSHTSRGGAQKKRKTDPKKPDNSIPKSTPDLPKNTTLLSFADEDPDS